MTGKLCPLKAATHAVSHAHPHVHASLLTSLDHCHREPAILSVFMALAKHRQIVEGSVKVTAFEGLPSMAPPSPGACHVLAFPSRAEYINVPLALAGQSALRAVAENRPQLPKLDPAVARAKVGEDDRGDDN